MPILTLKFEGRPVAEYRVMKGKAVTIGRKNNNDVVIENLAVPGHHARIESVDDKYLLADLKSKNGTFVNDQLVTSHWLSHGDVLTVGKHTLVFGLNEGEAETEEMESRLDKTMALDTEKFQDMLARSYTQTAQGEIERERIGTLTLLRRAGEEVKLRNKLIRIGKDPTCDIVVQGFLVGRTAATISRRPAGYYLSYVGGFSRPKVNGTSVQESIKLEEFDLIEVGSYKMQFLYRDVFRK